MVHGGSPGDFRRVVVPQVRHNTASQSPFTQVWLKQARHVLRGGYRELDKSPFDPFRYESVWEFVAAITNVVYVYHNLPPADSLVRFSHHALILYTLARLKQTSPQRIPDTWIMASFEALIASLNDDIAYTAASVPDALEMVRNLVTRVGAIVPFTAQLSFRPGTGLVVRCVQ
ncbi:hypothetical protein RTBOTA2_002709 [Rhodotorula toruloides]|uniref:Uncharacterized protein n=1 Tax=Rhodotorula toruloides TaxID=5286 RepID=A0A2T0AFK3_RHOTO|nr:hypothetical protein RTBOTA2_002709 [Rhodotorula toruloides]PRQ76773.1 hypothetical protein AAT19DRAFT_12191 [Rhodotorula toruloides]